MNYDPDEKKLIYNKVKPLPVPIWQNKKESSDCHLCNEKFGLIGDKHNCRLCGFIICSQCSAKYHIPNEYKLKKKSGAVRVCLLCRDKCLQKDKQPSDIEIHPPPVWVDENSQHSCAKCSIPWNHRNHKHHCRICGHMYCDKCSTKMKIPLAYHKKLEKKGPKRVCDLCRYLIISGATLSEEPLNLQDLPIDEPVNNRNENENSVKLMIKWKHDGSYICHLDAQPSLKEYEQALYNVRPELKEEKLQFFVRNKLVDPVHYDIFKSEYLVPVLFIDRSGLTNMKPGVNVLEQHDIKIHSKRASNIRIKAKNAHKRKDEYGIALYDYKKKDDKTHLTFYAGDKILVTKRDSDAWWFGKTTNAKGWFPASYVKLLHQSK